MDFLTFLLGFFSCLFFVALIAALNAFRKPSAVNGRKAKMLHLILLAIVGLAAGKLIHLEIQQHHVARALEQKAEMRLAFEKQEAHRISSMAALMNDILRRVEQEINADSSRRVSESTIRSIAAFSKALEPYKYIKADTLSAKKWSPERAQLMQQLMHLPMHSASWQSIKAQADFSYADLEDANLSGADLTGIKLDHALLDHATFKHGNFAHANLRHTSMHGINLLGSDGNHANLEHADLSWANLDSCILIQAKMQGANLSSASLRGIDALGVDLRWSMAKAALFNHGNLEEARMLGATLERANFSHCKLEKADLNLTKLFDVDMSEASMANIKLNRAEVSAIFFDQLSQWKVPQLEEVLEKYVITPEGEGRAQLSKNK